MGEDCSSYFTCVEESSGLKAYTVSCPTGLHYNPSIEKCDWPKNAKCASQQNVGKIDHQTPTVETIPTGAKGGGVQAATLSETDLRWCTSDGCRVRTHKRCCFNPDCLKWKGRKEACAWLDYH